MSTPIITLSNITRSFASGDDETTVLKNVSLTINQGEMVAIVGASGSGKSTLMNIIGCLDKPSSGEIYINGVAAHSASSSELAQLRSQNIGFIFQRYHLLPYLTARENVAMPSLYTAMPKPEQQYRTHMLLQRLGLEHRLDYFPAQLSGGQQQRVSICRALMNGANIILADEPTGALDSSSGQELMSVMHALHDAGHTIIIVTHDINVARQAERIIEIADGVIHNDSKNSHRERQSNVSSMPPANVAQRATLWNNILEAISMAWRALLGHRMRAFLSMLGIIIGIASVVSSMAVGEGARRTVMEELSKFGKNTLEIRPGAGWGDKRAKDAKILTIDDVDLLNQQSWVENATQVVTSTSRAINGEHDTTILLYGVSQDFFQIQPMDYLEGAPFITRDIGEREPVMVIDDTSRKILFPNDAEVEGKIVQLNGSPWRVVAVANKIGPKVIGGMSSAWVPWTSLTERLVRNKPFDSIIVSFEPGMSIAEGRQRTEALLLEAHGTRDFFTQSDEMLADARQKASNSLSLLITAIAGISLLVGGVGVMNVMLVSVTERTHEIGIRLSVGARQGDIMLQFLVESIVICILGGLLGVVCAWLSSKLFILFNADFTFVFTLEPVLLACGFSALIGLGFGFVPARNAARLNPTEALARE